MTLLNPWFFLYRESFHLQLKTKKEPKGLLGYLGSNTRLCSKRKPSKWRLTGVTGHQSAVLLSLLPIARLCG